MPDLLHKIIRFDELPSTNTKCMELSRQGNLPPYSIIITDKQTDGKGQNGNKWLSAQGLNLTFSLYVPHKFLAAKNQFSLNKAISIGLCKGIHSIVNLQTTIKWPNDIFIEDEKVAGILIENQMQGNAITNSIVGIGINVNQTQFDTTYGNPTSLYLHKGIKLDLQEVLDIVIKRIMHELNKLKEEKFSEIQEVYDSILYRKNQVCSIKTPYGKTNGTIIRVNNEGALVFSNDQGIHVKNHGEIKINVNETLH